MQAVQDSFAELARRIRMLFHRRQLRDDLDEEILLHLELRRQQHIDAGASPIDARTAAHRRFGNTTLIKEKSQMAWGWIWLEQLMQDVVYGVRAMLRSPALTLVALLSLALGIGANTAIFSLMDAVMLRSLPVKDPSQLILLGKGEWDGISDSFGITELYSYPFYRQFQQRNQVFSDVGAIFSMRSDIHGTVEGRKEPEPMKVQIVTGTYFSMLGVRAELGRTLNDSDDKVEGAGAVAVISDSWWSHNLNRDPGVLGKKLIIGSTVFSIVGVAPPEFFGTKVGEAPEIWVPTSMMKDVPPHIGGYSDNFAQSLNIIGRLKPGVSIQQATSDVNLVFRQILLSFPDSPLTQQNLALLQKTHVPLTPIATGLSELRHEFSDPLKILMAIVALVLLIACANIANLLLARSTARARELAVRQALGAGRSRLIRQLLAESLVLAIAGGTLGIAVASIAIRLLLRMVSAGEEAVPLNVSIDLRLLLFTLAITIGTALLFGTIPAFRATRLQLTESLKEGRSTSNTTTRSPLARILVISQIAFSLVLLVGSGLFLRTLINLNKVDLGFNKQNVLRLQTDASSIGYKEDEPRLTALYQQIEARVSTLPGVHAASYSAFTFHEGSWNGTVWVNGFENDKNVDVKHNVIGNGYFSTMHIPIFAGRAFGPQDNASSQKVAIISEYMARTMFPAGSPIGRHYGIGGPEHSNDIEVIGIARDVKFGSLDEKPETIDYIPYTQRRQYLNDFEVSYSGDLASISTAVQRAIHSIDPNLPITRVTTLGEQVGRSITNQRLVAQLSTFFGALAVFLSCIGIYGLMSYVVARRTNEIGVRMALGAARSNVRWLVMREILLLVLTGIIIGIPATLAVSRLVTNMLFGIHGTDSFSMLSAVLILLAVAAIAGYIPARRASRIDPMVALRYE